MGTAASKMTPVGEGRERRPWEGPGQAARNGANEKIQAKPKEEKQQERKLRAGGKVGEQKVEMFFNR